METYRILDNLNYEDGKFSYQKSLTTKLDNSKSDPLNQELLNEIVLWKINRYVHFDTETFDLINRISVEDGVLNDELTRSILHHMLGQKGVRLPMASTILRFRNPHIYQIIDQRAFRFAGMSDEEFKTTFDKSEKSIEKQINLYLKYLTRLREITIEKHCDFHNLDRVLYYRDKELNGEHTIKY